MAADGANNQQVASRLGIERETAGIWRTRWPQASEQLAAADAQADDKQLVALACESPQESGRPVTRWTPRELADAVCRHGIVEAIAPRTVGRFFKRSGLTAAFVPLLAQ
jgi:transposase